MNPSSDNDLGVPPAYALKKSVSRGRALSGCAFAPVPIPLRYIGTKPFRSLTRVEWGKKIINQIQVDKSKCI